MVLAGATIKASDIQSLSDLVNNPPRAKCIRTTALTMVTSTWTACAFDVEEYDSDGIHAPGSSVFTIVTPGLYQLSGGAGFAANSTGFRGVRWSFNSSPLNAGQFLVASSSSSFEMDLVAQTIEISLVAGDTIQMELFQSSGGNLNSATTSQGQPRAQLRWVASS